MTRLRLGALAAMATALLAFPIPTNATTLFPQEFKCPVGGEKFTANVVGSSSSWGQRPDGREYGTLPVYPITECPKNGFLLVKDKFTRPEIAMLAPLVASAEYQAMRQAETPHYRAWWLLAKLGSGPYELAGTLMQAAWETDADQPRKARYQKAFVDAVGLLVRDAAHQSEWFWLNLRAANARRELGDFAGAASAMDRIDKPELLPTAEDQRRGALELLAGLRVLVAERNAAAEPASLIPLDMAIERCGATGLTASEIKVCGSPELAARKAEVDKARAEFDNPELQAAANEAAQAAMDAAQGAYDAAKRASRKRYKRRN